MKRLFFLNAVLFLFSIGGFAQSSYLIDLTVVDSLSEQALNGTSIIVIETGLVFKTNKDGKVTIKTTKFPFSIELSNIGYNKKLVIIDKQENRIIQMACNVNVLNPLVISTPKPMMLIRETPFYITDYEIKNDSIYFIGYKNKSKGNAFLIIANLNGDTLGSVKVENAEKLYKDCFGNIHVLCNNYCAQVYVSSSGIELLYPISRVEFEEAFAPIQAFANDTFYVKNYSHADQVLDYYTYSTSERKLVPFVTVTNEKNIFMLRDYGRIASGFTEADARFEKMCFYKPVVAPIILNKDSVFLFNFNDSTIDIYNANLQLVSSSEITKDFYSDFKDQIINDPVNNTFYALKIKKGHCKLVQIDPTTANCLQQFDIPDLPFVQKISVWNNKIYFLYSDFAQTGYKKLYVLKI